MEWWKQSCHLVPAPIRKGTSSTIMLVAWCIWKHQKAIIFENAQLSLSHLLDAIKGKTTQWAMAGAGDLAALLPDMAAPTA